LSSHRRCGTPISFLGDSHDPFRRRRRYAGSAGSDKPGLAGQNENVAPNAAAPALNGSSYRLMIINGNSGSVIYDDGRDDMFCVTRHYFVGWDYYGRRLCRRTMECR
jgi:hypothetical protein